MSAGKEFLNIGLVEGAALVAIGDTLRAQEILASFSDVIESVRNQKGPRTPFEEGEQRGRLANVSLGSAYEVLSLVQG